MEIDIKWLTKKLNIMCDKAKEDWIRENCSKIKELEAQHKMREMWGKRERGHRDRQRQKAICIMSNEGRVLFDQQENSRPMERVHRGTVHR